MRLLACGSRNWNDRAIIHTTLAGWQARSWGSGSTPDEVGDLVVISGGAPGADTMAHQWARTYAVSVVFDAEWDLYGRRAGPLRNRRMLEEGSPEIIVAFSDQPISVGTANMCSQASKAGLPVYVVGRYR